jgi:type IV pilus assembly protein PilW
MSASHPTTFVASARSERGFTLVELMVTVAIAMFLLFGLVTIVENVRTNNLNQQALAQLQDQQRFAMTVITDVIQAGGYYPDPTIHTKAQDLPVNGAWDAGQALLGTHPGGAAPDTLSVRYATAGGDGVILCDGSTNNAGVGVINVYINQFTIVAPGPGVPGGLYCQVNNGGPSAVAPGVPLVTGIQSMTIWYGVKRNPTDDDYNVDTYLTADQMAAGGALPGGDWDNISSVRVQLVFTNPLANQPGQLPTITFQRVVEVMGRGGV